MRLQEERGLRPGGVKRFYGRRHIRTPQVPHKQNVILTLCHLSHHKDLCGLSKHYASPQTGSIDGEKLVEPHNMSDTASDTASSVGSIIEEASEPDTTTFKCLFCQQQWNRVPDMFAHCRAQHGFDVEETIKGLGPGSKSDLS